MSAPPAKTTFTPRGRLNGVLRRSPTVRGAAADELDTQAYEALYYRARLVLGDSLPRPARLQAR